MTEPSPRVAKGREEPVLWSGDRETEFLQAHMEEQKQKKWKGEKEEEKRNEKTKKEDN